MNGKLKRGVQNMTLILASQSPRRRELLNLLDIPYLVEPAEIDEGIDISDPERLVRELALQKALNVASQHPKDYVLAADTVVCLDEILGKPKDAKEAYDMLKRLSGRTHKVYTGVTLLSKDNNFSRTIVEVTEVDFRIIRPQELEEYIKSGEPLDKAGAYGIQGYAGVFVTSIRGSYHNVVGLPLAQTAVLLGEAGLYSKW